MKKIIFMLIGWVLVFVDQVAQNAEASKGVYSTLALIRQARRFELREHDTVF